MVRAALVVVTVGLFVGATACSGRSTNDDDSSGGKSGSAGENSGGSATGGSAGTSSGSGGSAAGGSAGTSGDDDDGPIGGTSSGGTAPGGSSGASPTTGGTSPTGGSAGSSTGGTSGEGGSAGAGECEGPAPGGCQDLGCPSGQTCTLASGVCIPSSCECMNGEWACTRDCGGGRCVHDPSSCTTPNPSGCENEDDCASGDVCVQPTIAVCIPIGCACGFGSWQCREECGGGVCTQPMCPTACEPQQSGACGVDRVTWVCTTGPIPVQEFMDGGCTDEFTQVPRYCCPTMFKPECQ